MQDLVARFNVLLEDLDRRVRGLADAYLLANERIVELNTRIGQGDARVGGLEMTVQFVDERVKRLETTMERVPPTTPTHRRKKP